LSALPVIRYSPADRLKVIRPFEVKARSRESDERVSRDVCDEGTATRAMARMAEATIIRM